MSTAATTISVVLIVFLFGTFVGMMYKQSEIDKLRKDKERVFEHWRQKVGSTTLWNGELTNYNLSSFDAGDSWYLVEYDHDWKMKII